MTRLLHFLGLLTAAAILAGSTGCQRQDETTARKSGFKEFIPLYNQYIHSWLKEQQQATEEAIAQMEAKLSTATGSQAETLAIRHQSLLKERETWQFRLSIGDYFQFSDPSRIPTDLVWQDGMGEPEIGDPRAKKGGVMRMDIPSYPPTIRPIGSNSNHSLRGEIYDYIDITLVGMHPETLGGIPGVAKQWALSEDGRTTYFRLHPQATYSDGVPVKAVDYLFNVYVYVSDNIVNPYSKQFYREQVAQMVAYDDHTLSITLSEAKYQADLIAGSFTPSAPHFYEEYGPDYEEHYQWRFPPTTGAYEIREEDIIKGVSLTQTRVKDWWARDLKYYRHRFNADKVVHILVRDPSKAFELFRAGEVDSLLYTRPDRSPNFWYEKSEMDQVYNGYIERFTFYKQYPKIPVGLYLNVIKNPLDNRDVRVGINHAMNWQKVISIMFRGDAVPLNAFNEGYLDFSDPSIQARPYSIEKARDLFTRAGYTQEDRDGILMKPDGTRLSISVTYKTRPAYDQMFSILREEAKACGLDLRLEGLEPTVTYKKVMQKQHEMNFGGWIVQPPLPRFHDFLHSINAFDDKGNPKPQTNNIFTWGRPDTDRLSEIVRTGRTKEEIRKASWETQRIMHEEAMFIPAYSVDYDRVGSWRWVRWPDCENTRFCPPIVYDPHEVFVYWIDEEIKRETQQARRNGKAFPEVMKTVDAYRILPPAEDKPELQPAELPEAP